MHRRVGKPRPFQVSKEPSQGARLLGWLRFALYTWRDKLHSIVDRLAEAEAASASDKHEFRLRPDLATTMADVDSPADFQP